MAKKRILSLALALLLVVSVPLTVVAQGYDLVNGDITVTADDSGQYVSQGGGQNELQTSDTVISSSSSTDNTITISTAGSAAAEITIKDLNVSTNQDTSTIDVGSSTATIKVEGDNQIERDGSAFAKSALIHVSDGNLTLTSENGGALELDNRDTTGAAIGSNENEDFSGDIRIDGNIDLDAGTTIGTRGSAGIGSGKKGDFTGTVTIAGDANVDAIAQDNGAGIGSGYGGEMSGTITIGENAQVSASSDDDGAGIGSGGKGEMSGTITIGGNAQVSASSNDDGAGIGSGYKGEMSGTITIGENAQVTAASKLDGAGIGSSQYGEMSGTISILGDAEVDAASCDQGAGIGSGLKGELSGDIIIGGNARVTASSSTEAPGIGIGSQFDRDYIPMTGTIVIRDNARVTANAGQEGSAAIGGENDSQMEGVIAILGNAQVVTGVVSSVEMRVDPATGQVILTVATEAGKYGNIGGQNNAHDWAGGSYIFAPDATVNGVKGSEVNELDDYVNFFHDPDTDEKSNYIRLDVGVEDGKFVASATGARVRKIQYKNDSYNSTIVPTAPGRYEVLCVLLVPDKEMDESPVILRIGELIIPEKDPPIEPIQPIQPEKPVAQTADNAAPLYRVVDRNGRDVPIRSGKNGTVYSISTNEAQATLTGNLYCLKIIRSWGVEQIEFTTPEGTFTFPLDTLIQRGTDFQSYYLTHDGTQVSFTLNGESVADILI